MTFGSVFYAPEKNAPGSLLRGLTLGAHQMSCRPSDLISTQWAVSSPRPGPRGVGGSPPVLFRPTLKSPQASNQDAQPFSPFQAILSISIAIRAATLLSQLSALSSSPRIRFRSPLVVSVSPSSVKSSNSSASPSVIQPSLRSNSAAASTSAILITDVRTRDSFIFSIVAPPHATSYLRLKRKEKGLMGQKAYLQL